MASNLYRLNFNVPEKVADKIVGKSMEDYL